MVELAEQPSESNAPVKPSKYFSQDELISLIKKNLKIKRKNAEEGVQPDHNKENQNQDEKEVYRLTINNFIAPSINFMNPQSKPLN